MHYCYSYKEHWMPKNIPVIFRMYQINLDGKKRIYQKYWNQYEHFIEEHIKDTLFKTCPFSYITINLLVISKVLFFEFLF